VLKVRLLAGVKVATLVVALYVTDPGTTVVPGPVTLKLVPLMEEGSIASLKVAVIVLFSATPAAPQRGTEAVGCEILQLVQSEQAAIKSSNGTPVNTHNHFINTLYLRMAFILEAFTAHEVRV